MKKYCLFIITAILCGACHARIDEVDTMFEGFQIRDTIPGGLKAWSIFEEKDGIYFIAKPKRTDSLFFYREGFSDFTLEKVYALPSSYVDTMGAEMNSYQFQIIPITKDSIIIFTRHTITLLSLNEGKMLKHYSFSHENENVVMVDRAGPLKWNPYRKVLPVMIVRRDNRENRRWEWDSELLGEFSLETGELTILPVSYPQVREYTNFILSSLRSDPLITFSRNRYVVGFQGTPVVFSCDMQTHKCDSLFLCNPLYQPYPAYYDTLKLKEDMQFLRQMLKSAVCDFYYTAIEYDATKDVYYRFFVREQSEFDSTGRPNEFFDKETGFTILDKDLHILGETHWKIAEAYSTAWYPTSKGTYGFTHNRVGKSCGKSRNGNIIRFNWTKKG